MKWKFSLSTDSNLKCNVKILLKMGEISAMDWAQNILRHFVPKISEKACKVKKDHTGCGEKIYTLLFLSIVIKVCRFFLVSGMQKRGFQFFCLKCAILCCGGTENRWGNGKKPLKWLKNVRFQKKQSKYCKRIPKNSNSDLRYFCAHFFE